MQGDRLLSVGKFAPWSPITERCFCSSRSSTVPRLETSTPDWVFLKPVETLGYLPVPSEALASLSGTTRFCSHDPEGQRHSVNGDIALVAQKEAHSAAFGEGSDSHCFQARSRSRQKRLLASSYPSVRSCVYSPESAGLPLVGFSLNLILETDMKNLSRKFICDMHFTWRSTMFFCWKWHKLYLVEANSNRLFWLPKRY
jgi:hypothetical protein